MGRYRKFLVAAFMIVLAGCATTERVADVPSRPGITERVLVLAPENPKAVVVLFAGGHGGLQIGPNGGFSWGEGNFLVRSRQLFASQGLMVVVVDAPSDRQQSPFLGGFRQTPEHVADIKALIAWLKQRANVPVWLVGTSRGTQSVAFVATMLPAAEGGPDGIVLTSTILTDPGSRPVPAMPLANITAPVLVAHHKLDGCGFCNYRDLPKLMDKLTAVPRKELLTFEGGMNRGDPCEAMAYHGFNGIEQEVVAKVAEWITRKERRNQPVRQRQRDDLLRVSAPVNVRRWLEERPAQVLEILDTEAPESAGDFPPTSRAGIRGDEAALLVRPARRGHD